MKTKGIVFKTRAEHRAEMDAMPTATRHRDRIGMRVTEHGTLSRLQPGMVIRLNGEEHIVETVNDCRAVCKPLNRRKTVVQIRNPKNEKVREFEPETTGGPVSISPNADVDILRRQ